MGFNNGFSSPSAPAGGDGNGDDDPVWAEEYRVDLSAELVHDFKAPGADEVDIGGATWTAIHGSYSSAMDLDGSNGFVLNPSAGSDLYTGADRAPRIIALVSDLIDGWNVEQDTIALIVRFSTTPSHAAVYDFSGLVLQKGDGAAINTTTFLKVGTIFHGVALKASVSTTNETYENISESANAIEIIIYPSGVIRVRQGVFAWSGLPSTVIPTPGDDTNWTTIHYDAIWNKDNRVVDPPDSWEDGAPIGAGDLHVGMTAHEVSSGTGIVATFIEIIALRED